MRVKGLAVQSISQFVRKKFPLRYDEWLRSLPPIAQGIFLNPLVSSEWYDLNDAMSIPTRKLCDLFYKGGLEGAWECGKFSADQALSGIYKVFVRLGSPGFIINRATSLFTTYYSPSALKIVTNEKHHAAVQVVQFADINPMVEHRIGGWMERVLEISGCRGISLKITRAISSGHPVTEYDARWQ
ncbi:MAG: hypothetical protein A2268_05060 [Candidatus Raymondbacteria bacterium RifOxyA12_full_50_37]|uniref:Uncharacterized protein n=1 Tax=Candidatus Raymondbacteria bacterium RIFOXYD12_FULL_49_13 TaxID=1817890 RepID=A0A1F7FDB4_UNCRA|nr:MAG: hypothetical protein A2268_05060 [Candidatus Raymondbacteria bacterium RifOxyA12_full_50_37]OGJ94113.1 MAG: hypothetical protein A2248_12265 [Candidatus Raymondbacteria bacterium RIFOXYA2_FULL_49_16]OGJ94317.1 MAG: hypothetical protein A2350_01015 [Candidatus Raymondbacteria bacterium RifOxyB12_full_50_8]OGJ96938.1 MAG: hypothetical protein A2453_04865 [Candidatus Raymondbacteria bacterium RIFOXYC2_FULL_50_21]OGK04664.1 MAG: hypothetical protein A2519_21030 [Candidatus Raymondbacteria b